VIRGNCQFSISTFTSKGSTAVSEIRVTTYNSSYEQRQQQLVEDRDAVANCLTVRATPIRPHAAWAATPAHRPTHTDTRPTRAHCSVIDYSRSGVCVFVLMGSRCRSTRSLFDRALCWIILLSSIISWALVEFLVFWQRTDSLTGGRGDMRRCWLRLQQQVRLSTVAAECGAAGGDRSGGLIVIKTCSRAKITLSQSFGFYTVIFH